MPALAPTLPSRAAVGAFFWCSRHLRALLGSSSGGGTMRALAVLQVRHRFHERIGAGLQRLHRQSRARRGPLLLPANIYVSIAPGISRLQLTSLGNSAETNYGFGAKLAIGKEWWVGDHWGLGVARRPGRRSVAA
jgi:hypothetical protein